MASVTKRKWTTPKGEKKEAWLVRYFDGEGVHRARTFIRKKEADAFSHSVSVEVQKGVHIAQTQTVTVNELLDHFIEWCEMRHKNGQRMGSSHLKTIKAQSRNHIRPAIGRYKMTDLTFNILDNWARTLTHTPSLAPRTVRSILHFFKMATDYGMRRGWANRNLTSEVMQDYRSGARARIRTFSKIEVQAILSNLQTKPLRIFDRTWRLQRCFVYLATFCGLRIGEINGLRVENIDFEGHVLEVRHNLTAAGELKGPKTRSGIRDVPMPAIVEQELRNWLASFYQANEDGLIFRGRNGGQISHAQWHVRYWQPLLDRCLLGPDEKGRRFHFHALRHFCASMLVEQGVPLTDAAELLGHSSFDMTLQVYAHAIMASQKRIEVLQSVADSLLPPVAVLTLRQQDKLPDLASLAAG